MRGERGFVLVNALLIVAALSAMAVFLLARAEGARARLQTGLDAEQIELDLDAFEALAQQVIARDAPLVDHFGEAWAETEYNVPLARGQVAGRLSDLQGRFNLNWLANPDNALAQAAFDRLLDRLGVTASVGEALRAVLQPGGPEDRAPYLLRDPQEVPLGGAVMMLSQLRDLPGFPEAAFARLRPYIAVLPAGSRLNVNTAPPEVLAAFLPDLSRTALGAVLSRRETEPFRSTDAFLSAAGRTPADARPEGTPAPAGAEDSLIEDAITVASRYFGIESTATLGTQSASRTALLERRGAAELPVIAWRITTWP
ncbi:type II secretion system minor pseudopilin GspK [Salipiger abyssi]|uniref:Type II secretion system protein K n=1 Tax=Salipiger abyssi TaxID=1250539 RepID=A0A1P8UXB9_9RHOB|nr:type II secretion system minor pseudopilin GspK [Salipiger abyssi]APZ54040.1 general secretion pathway protein K [Salipiger abyssi]